MKKRVENLVWCRNELVKESNATVNILSGMAQFGLNVFEGIRCYSSLDGEGLYAFRLQEHLQRLSDSCKLIGLNLPDNLDQIEYNFKKTVQANNFDDDVAVRVTVFADGQGSWNSISPVSYFIAPMAKTRTVLGNIVGLKACVSSWRRISDSVLPPRAKVGANYMNGRFAHLQAVHDGYDVPIFLDQRGQVSETAGACVMFVKKGILITPSVTCSILDSITRDTIIHLAHELGILVEERVVDKTELYLADEIFICGTAAEITPITQIDKYTVGDGLIGDITSELLKNYLNLVRGENETYSNWLTDVEKKC